MAPKGDAEFGAQEARANAIIEAEGPYLKRLIQAAVALAQAPATEARNDRLSELAGELSRVIVPHTVCASGCSHCCHMATALSGYEAQAIGRFTGRAPRQLGRQRVADFGLELGLQARYTGVRCTFLDDAGRCTVYPVRPLACRLHHSLEASPEPCRIEPPNAGAPVAHLNLLPFEIAIAAAFFDDDFGDIREFFPDENASVPEWANPPDAAGPSE